MPECGASITQICIRAKAAVEPNIKTPFHRKSWSIVWDALAFSWLTASSSFEFGSGVGYKNHFLVDPVRWCIQKRCWAWRCFSKKPLSVVHCWKSQRCCQACAMPVFSSAEQMPTAGVHPFSLGGKRWRAVLYCDWAFLAGMRLSPSALLMSSISAISIMPAWCLAVRLRTGQHKCRKASTMECTAVSDYQHPRFLSVWPHNRLPHTEGCRFSGYSAQRTRGGRGANKGQVIGREFVHVGFVAQNTTARFFTRGIDGQNSHFLTLCREVFAEGFYKGAFAYARYASCQYVRIGRYGQ